MEFLKDTNYPWSHALVLHVCVGWAWDHGFETCESTSYIITRVHATSLRSLFLILSTLVVFVGEFELVK